MADYKRFVSYMYEYEKGIKKKNVGYVRVEIRNGECRFTIHMQLEGFLEGIFPTYLIYRPASDMELIYLGDCTAKNQVIDSRLSAKEYNTMDSGHRFSDMGGVLLFLNSGVFYATEWDDRQLVLEEVLQALKPKSKEEIPYEKTADAKEAPTAGKKQEAIRVDTKTAENKTVATTPILIKKPTSLKKPPDLNVNTSANRTKYILPGGGRMDAGAWHTDSVTPTNPWEMVEKYKKFEAEGRKLAEAKGEKLFETEGRKLAEGKGEKLSEAGVGRLAEASDEGLSEAGNRGLTEIKEEKAQRSISKKSSEAPDRDIISKVKRSFVEKAGEERRQRENPLVERIFSAFPRIYPFEDNEVRRCVKIEPKDIGVLPSDTWILSNNSFLLHGYYCYHHLVFAEISNSLGCIYILGVPGIYHNRERFMARMFGFDCFKSIRKRELKQGDFGYWYLEVGF